MVNIEKETWRQGLLLSHGASWMQANVYLIHHGDQKIVIKDFGSSPWLVRRTFCRFALSRETKAIQLLAGYDIAPRYLGRIGDDAYAMEYIEGENFQYKKHVKNIDNLLEMEQTIKRMHEAGVAHNDLHGKNIIIKENGKIYFIDFASAVFRDQRSGIFPWLNNQLFYFLAIVDKSKVLKLKNKYDPAVITVQDSKFLLIKKIISFFTRLWKKTINGPFLRKRTWKKRKEYFQKWLVR